MEVLEPPIENDLDQDTSYILEQNKIIEFEDTTLDYFLNIKDYVNSMGFQIGSKLTLHDLIEFLRKDDYNPQEL